MRKARVERHGLNPNRHLITFFLLVNNERDKPYPSLFVVFEKLYPVLLTIVRNSGYNFYAITPPPNISSPRPSFAEATEGT